MIETTQQQEKSKVSLHECLRRFGRCSSPASLEDEIQKILASHPESVRETDDVGGMTLPLHAAFEHIQYISIQSVRSLVDAYPASVREKDCDQKLPIHYACEHSQTIDVVGYLLDRYPESIVSRDSEGFTPLHYACDPSFPLGAMGEEQLNLIDFLLEKFPPSFRFDDFLLRIAPEKRPDQVERIILRTEGVPESLREPRLVLHALCHIRSASRTFCKYIDEIKKQKFFHGNDATINLMVDARDSKGNSILHTLANTNGFAKFAFETSHTFSEVQDEKSSLAIFESLCALRPGLVSSRNDAGDTPLHVVCRAHLPVAYLEAILRTDPLASGRRNLRGQLPVHCLMAPDSGSQAFSNDTKRRRGWDRPATSGPSEATGYVMEAIKILVASSTQPLLSTPDPVTGLVPFLATAVAGSSLVGENDDDGSAASASVVDIVAAILREDPSPLIQLTNTKKRKR